MSALRHVSVPWQRIGIEPLVKKELGRTIDVDTKIAFRAVGIRDRIGYFFA